MKLVTERLVIHEATSEDANRLSEQNSSDSVNEYLSSLSNLFLGGFAYTRLISDAYIGSGQLFVIFLSS